MRLRRLLAGDLQTLMVGNVFESGMRFGAFVVYSRALNPEGVGVVALITALVYLTIDLSQVGIDTAVISLGSKEYGSRDLERVKAICRAGLWLHLALGVPLAVGGAAIAPQLAGRYLKDPSLSGALALAFAGSALIRLSEYALSVLRTYQRFKYYAVAGMSAQLFLLSASVALALLGRLTVGSVVVLVLFFTPLVRLFVALLGVPTELLGLRAPRAADLRTVLGFGKWVWGTALIEAGVRRLNVLLLQSFAGNEATGYFSLASRYAEFLSLIFEPLRKYLLPKFTALASFDEIARFVRRTYVWLAWTLLLVPAAWIAAAPMISILHGAEWQPAVILFRILVPARLVFLLSKPLAFTLFSLKRPQAQTRLHLLAAVVYLASAAVAVPLYGAEGSASCILGFSATLLLAHAWYVQRLLRAERRTSAL